MSCGDRGKDSAGTGDLKDQQGPGWGFPTNHARVLLAIARNPDLRLRDIAAARHITERTVQAILTDLEQAGCACPGTGGTAHPTLRPARGPARGGGQ
ncbi:MarR family transcriptional regulator [Streptomyces sp. NPDC003730]